MQERYTLFDALENELLERLKARGCSSITITGYRYLYNSIISWLKENRLESYTKENGNAFSYFFDPNEAPDDIMGEIEHYVEQAKSGKQPSFTPKATPTATPTCSDEAVYCRKCGFKLLPDSTFCTKCGSVID